MKLTDIFGSLAGAWPVGDIDTSFPSSTDGVLLTGQMVDAVEVEDVITDVAPDGTVAVTGKLTLDSLPPAPTSLVSRLFPSLRFEFAPEANWSSDFRVSTPIGGEYTLQVDTLPLKIVIPPDLLSAHPTKIHTEPGIELSDGSGDSTITRDFSFVIEADGSIVLDPHLPISIGPCRIFGIPATAVHDLSFIAAPARARASLNWIVRPLDPDAFPFRGGALGFGGIELDWTVEGSALKDLRDRLHLSDDAEVVLEDIVVPSVLLPPVPQHGSIGVRRTLDPGEPLTDFLTFADAPIVIPFGEKGRHAFLSKLFFATPPEEEELRSGLTVEGGYAEPGGGGDYEVEVGLIDGDLVRFSFAHVRPVDADAVPVLTLDLWKVVVDFFRIRAGVSMRELGKDSRSPAAAVQILVDILIREKPGDSPVSMKTEDDKPFEAALTDLGWDRGKPTGNMVMPKGAELHLSKFVLELHEMGLIYEQGATYISISGAIREKTTPLEGGIWFKRLRGKLAGDPDAPGFQLGGLGAELKVEDVVEITVGGTYRNEVLPDGTRVKEQGLQGGLIIYAGGNKWGLTLDVYWGERIPLTGDRTDYLLLLVALFGSIPIGPIELIGIEALYANSLLPKLEEGDREAGELKYYNWLKRARPTGLPETRGLEAWKPINDAWAFGFGLSISLIGSGTVFQLRAFGLGFDSPDDAGLIIVIEFGMFGSKKPLALGVLEYDFRRDAFVMMIQLDITLDELIDNWPEELKLKIGGTITFANKPGLVALGRLNAPDTWIGGNLELDLSELFELKVRLAACVEWLEDSHVGGGFTLSLRVKGSMSVIRLEGWGALEVLLRYMLSGSNDFVARLRFEMGFAVILFRFLRFGISIEMLAEWLAHVPNYFVFRVTFRFETPWFLPDVSYTLDASRGELDPGARGVVTSPLMQASCASPSGSWAARVQRVDGRVGGQATEVSSINALSGASGTWQGTATPVPLDARVEINFSVMLEDRLGIGAVNPDFGEQVTGDGELALTAGYALTGIVLRRRPLYGGAWEVVEEITSAASPRNFRWQWDVDTRTQGQVAPKKLLLNGSTPFTAGLDNPMADAEILEDNPAFPCCRRTAPDVARFDFSGETIGPIPVAFTRSFKFEGRGTIAPVRINGTPCAVRLPLTTGATVDRVGAFTFVRGQVFTITASEDLALAVLRISIAGRRKTRLVIVAVDMAGDEVGRNQSTAGAAAFIDVPIEPASPFRMVHVTLEDLQIDSVHVAASSTVGEAATLVLDSIECVTASDRAHFDRERDRCSRESSDGLGDPVSFLSRHEYEVAITTEVGIKHSSTDWEKTTLTERVSFITKGPPGLNETAEPGLELAPYVVSMPPGGNGLTYREESVHIVLAESLRIFGPGAGAVEADYRMPVTIAVESAFDSVPEARSSKSSRESADWFLTHRSVPDPWLHFASLDVVTALSRDLRVLRYQNLTDASTGTCEPDDVWHEQQPRVGIAPFDAAGRPLWDASASYIAALRLAGSPVVDRAPFETADVNALSDVTGSWSVVEGALTATLKSEGSFGEETWDLLVLDLRGKIGEGGEIGAAVLVDAARPSQGVRAFVRRGAGDAGTLDVESTSGVPLGSQALASIGDVSALMIEVFADAIRCRCGEASISVARDDRGAGRCAVMATSASIVALRVRGIDMYRLPFRTSLYEGFGEHIASCTGIERYDAGAAAESLASVWSRLGGKIGTVMTASAAAEDREVVFNDAASALALPLREDADRLHVTVANAASERWFVLELPEPLDFAEEVALQLEQELRHPVLSALDKARLGAMIVAAIRNPAPTPGWPFGRHESIGVRALFPVSRPARGGLRGAPIIPRKVAYTVRIVGRYLEVTAIATNTVRNIRATGFTAADRDLLSDVSVDLNVALDIVRWHDVETVEWIARPVSIIQNAEATKAIVLPNGIPLTDGIYRLSFTITRRWFETTDAPGPENTYSDTGVIAVPLAG